MTKIIDILFTNRVCFKRLIAPVLFPIMFFACTSGEPVKPGVQAFREQIFSDFNLLKTRLIPALETDRPIAAAGREIEDFLLELKNKDQGIFGISLLDLSGEYLTGFVIDNKDTGKLIKDKYKDTNFHSYRVVEQIVNSRKVIQEQLYLQDTSILAIGFPLIREGDLLGILCFSFKSREFEKKWGLSEKEFLQTDFGKL